MESGTVGTCSQAGEESQPQLWLVMMTIGLCALAAMGILFAMVVHPGCASVSVASLAIVGYLWYEKTKQLNTKQHLEQFPERPRITAHTRRQAFTRAVSLMDREKDAGPEVVTEEDMQLLLARSKFYSSM